MEVVALQNNQQLQESALTESNGKVFPYLSCATIHNLDKSWSRSREAGGEPESACNRDTQMFDARRYCTCKFSIRRRSEDKDRLGDWPHGAIRSSNVIILDGREGGGKGKRGEVKVWSRVKATSAS